VDYSRIFVEKFRELWSFTEKCGENLQPHADIDSKLLELKAYSKMEQASLILDSQNTSWYEVDSKLLKHKASNETFKASLIWDIHPYENRPILSPILYISTLKALILSKK